MAQARNTGWLNEYRQTFRLAAPIVLTQLSQVALMVTDTLMIGRLGGQALAATTLATLSFYMFFVALLGVVHATAPLASQYFGARQPRMVRRVVRQGLWATIVLSVPGCFLLSQVDAALLLLGQDPAIVGRAMGYMDTLLWSLPTAVGFIVLRNFVSALGKPVPAMLVMFGGIPINAGLNYVFIFGNFGAPPMGLAGAGLATAIVDLLMFLALLWIALARRPFRRYAILNRFWRPDWSVFRRLFAIGLPISGIMLLEFGFFGAGSLMMGWLGTTVLAAHQIAMQVPHVTFMVPMGIGQAATVRVGHAVGRRDAAGARRAGWAALTLGLLFMSLSSVVIWSFPETLAGFFVDTREAANAQLVSLAAGLLLAAAMFQLFDGAQGIAAGALRGLNDTRAPFLLALTGYWGIGCTAAYLIGFEAGLGGLGVWIGLATGLAATALFLVARFWRLTRRGYLPTLPVDAPVSGPVSGPAAGDPVADAAQAPVPPR